LVYQSQHRQRRKVDWEAPASPIDILIRRCSNRLSRLRLHIRRRRSLIANNPLPVLPTSIFKRIQTRSSSRWHPLVRPRVHGQRRELRRQCQSRRERRLPQQFDHGSFTSTRVPTPMPMMSVAQAAAMSVRGPTPVWEPYVPRSASTSPTPTTPGVMQGMSGMGMAL